MAIGNSLNPDCTVRACRTPRLFISILAKRLHPAVAAARTACRASLRCENHWPACHEPERAPRETGISLDEHVTSLVLQWSSIPPSWTSMKSDNVRDHRVRTEDLPFQNHAQAGLRVHRIVITRFLGLSSVSSIDRAILRHKPQGTDPSLPFQRKDLYQRTALNYSNRGG